MLVTRAALGTACTPYGETFLGFVGRNPLQSDLLSNDAGTGRILPLGPLLLVSLGMPQSSENSPRVTLGRDDLDSSQRNPPLDGGPEWSTRSQTHQMTVKRHFVNVQ